MDKNEYVRCGECGSEFLKSSSKMASLCPECSHILYGYPNCAHIFKNGRCINCCWDGSRSEYTKMVLNED
ncbi:MAG: hypothetical protein HFI70_05175 [Lachnospiraceae bacterium]|nr:hypothetical protein [Lachnospiraceae bacterium]